MLLIISFNKALKSLNANKLHHTSIAFKLADVLEYT